MQIKRLLCMVMVVLCTVGCSHNVNQNVDIPNETYILQEATVCPTYNPVEENVDIMSVFQQSEKAPFDENVEKKGLSFSGMAEQEYAYSEDIIQIESGVAAKLIIHCIWAPENRNVFVGLKNTTSQEVYSISATGGAISGIIDLSGIPTGKYQVILYSNDNRNVTSVLLYQLDK